MSGALEVFPSWWIAKMMSKAFKYKSYSMEGSERDKLILLSDKIKEAWREVYPEEAAKEQRRKERNRRVNNERHERAMGSSSDHLLLS